ncbi:hypothetical protein AHAS_Ahas02G0082400 [Arachis hypogaea]
MTGLVLRTLVNAALSSHEGNFIHPKTNKPVQIKDYQDYIPFLDKKKLASHPFGFIISQMRVFVGEKSLIDKDEGVKAPYVNINGQLCNICDEIAGDN